MHVLFYKTEPCLQHLKKTLLSYFHKEHISVTCTELPGDLALAPDRIHPEDAYLLFYRLSELNNLEPVNYYFQNLGLKIKTIALCQNYQEGIAAIDNGSDYALLLPLTSERIHHCCEQLCSRRFPTQKGAPMSAIDSPLSLKDEYKLLVDALHVSVSKHILDDSCTVIWANEYYYEMTGYSKREHTELFHNNCREYLSNYPNEYFQLKESVQEAFSKGDSFCETILHLPQKNGSYLWVRVKITFTKDTYNGYPVLYTVYTDIDQRIQAELERSITYDKLPGFAVKVQIHADRSFTLIESNRPCNTFCTSILFNLPAHYHDDRILVPESVYYQAQAHTSMNFESKTFSEDGDDMWFKVNAEYINTRENDPVYLFICLDISEQKRRLDEINRLSYVDSVTGGFNQERFEKEMTLLVSSCPANTYSLISVDVRKFKLVNELFGVQQGDRALKYIYDEFHAALSADEIVSRFSSDHFVLLLHQTEEQLVKNRLQEIIQHLNRFNASQDRKYYFAFNAGMYLIDTASLPLPTLLDRANIARKRAAQQTSDRLLNISCYSHSDSLALLGEKAIEDRMEGALKNREFEVYLQPKMSLKTSSIEGAEALVRWNDPQRGLISPCDFIPLFEKNGFITKMDLYVFEEVCKLIKKWMDMDIQPVVVSVNLSRVHLSTPDFLDYYETVRKKYCIPVRYLEFELTETMLLENPDRLKKVISDMRYLGYQCSMDDFGSGYSSLNILKDMDFDVMKLDRAFFKVSSGITRKEKDIISTVIDLAGKLNMISVAEGVETTQQMDFLKDTGCDFIQGFIFSKPLPVSDFEVLKYGQAF